MRRLGLIAAVLAVAGTAHGEQAHYRVTLNGSPIGEAFLEQKIAADGVKSISIRMELSMGGQKSTVRQQSSFAPSGIPIRSFQEVMLGKTRRSVLTTYDSDGANLVTEEHGERKLSHAKLGKGQPRAQKAEFWFLRETPSVGAHYQVYALAPGAMQWELTEVSYLGRRKVRFESPSRTVLATYDAHGVPVSIEDSGGTSMVRLESPGGQVR